MSSEHRSLSLLDWFSIGGFFCTLMQTILQVFSLGDSPEYEACLVNGDALYLWLLTLPFVAMSGIVFATLVQSITESTMMQIRLPIMVASMIVGVIVLSAAWYGSGCFTGHLFGGSAMMSGNAGHAFRLMLTVLTFAACTYAVMGRLQDTAPSGQTASRRRGDALLAYCTVGTLGTLSLAYGIGEIA